MTQAKIEAEAFAKRGKPHGYLSPAYCFVVPIVQKIAREVGYAVAVHGSMNSDLDLMAMPWTEEAGSTDELLAAILSGCSAFYQRDPDGNYSVCDEGFKVLDPGPPEKKPHGRLAWSIQLGSGARIDLSVMPPQALQEPPR